MNHRNVNPADRTPVQHVDAALEHMANRQLGKAAKAINLAAWHADTLPSSWMVVGFAPATVADLLKGGRESCERHFQITRALILWRNELERHADIVNRERTA